MPREMQSSSSPSKQPPNQSSAPEGSRGGAGGTRVRGTGLASAAPSRSTGSTSEVGSGAPEEPRPRRRRPPLWLRRAYNRLLPLLARVSINLRIQPPHKLELNIDRDDDRISALPDDVLLEILGRVDVREAVRAGAVSTRWRHLPHRLSRLHLDVCHFGGGVMSRESAVKIMEAFTGALCSLLSARPPPAECECAIKTLLLRFFPLLDLTSIGRAVEDVVARGEIECLEFHTCSPESPHSSIYSSGLPDEMGQQFMSFSRACPLAFRWLTMLDLNSLMLTMLDLNSLINACDRLRHLTLRSGGLVEPYHWLEIDTPCSGLQKLWFIDFCCRWIELIDVPKLREVGCQYWWFPDLPVRFGYIPELSCVSIVTRSEPSECLPWSSMKFSGLYLDLRSGVAFFKSEHLKQLTTALKNLTNVGIFGISARSLSWTLTILEAAPALQNFRLSREYHSCTRTVTEITKLWEPSKDLKHLNLKVLQMSGFEDEDMVTKYIRQVMERMVGLKRIELHGEAPCENCDYTDPGRRRIQVDEARRRRIKERLTHGSSSSVEIIIC